MRKKTIVFAGILALLVTLPVGASDQGKGQGKGKNKGNPSASAYAPGHGNVPPGHGGVPPGLAKKGGLPPGLAKFYGRPMAERVYVAFDPRREDRAWFLIDGRWVEHYGFAPTVRVEVHQALALPAIPVPPVPPPIPHLHVVLFVP